MEATKINSQHLPTCLARKKLLDTGLGVTGLWIQLQFVCFCKWYRGIHSSPSKTFTIISIHLTIFLLASFISQGELVSRVPVTVAWSQKSFWYHWIAQTETDLIKKDKPGNSIHPEHYRQSHELSWNRFFTSKAWYKLVTVGIQDRHHLKS